jgi:hypothetical protein
MVCQEGGIRLGIVLSVRDDHRLNERVPPLFNQIDKLLLPIDTVSVMFE